MDMLRVRGVCMMQDYCFNILSIKTNFSLAFTIIQFYLDIVTMKILLFTALLIFGKSVGRSLRDNWRLPFFCQLWP